MTQLLQHKTFTAAQLSHQPRRRSRRKGRFTRSSITFAIFFLSFAHIVISILAPNRYVRSAEMHRASSVHVVGRRGFRTRPRAKVFDKLYHISTVRKNKEKNYEIEHVLRTLSTDRYYISK